MKDVSSSEITEKEMTETGREERELMENLTDMCEETGTSSFDGERSKAGLREWSEFWMEVEHDRKSLDCPGRNGR